VGGKHDSADDVVFNEYIDCRASSCLAKCAELKSLVGNAAAMLREGGVLVMYELSLDHIPL
jgi:hypothetical protein